MRQNDLSGGQVATEVKNASAASRDGIDELFISARARGDLKLFNLAYKHYRKVCLATGGRPMHYRTAQKRLRKWLVQCIKKRRLVRFDQAMMWIFTLSQKELDKQ